MPIKQGVRRTFAEAQVVYERGSVPRLLRLVGLVSAALLSLSARAEQPTTREKEPPPLTVFGRLEAYYQWNFRVPSNTLTQYRGFDNRHNALTLSTAALGVSWDASGLVGRLNLQLGSTPSTYYLAEPRLPGTSAANASGPELWKYLEEAVAGCRLEPKLTLSAGLFLSPLGPESMRIHENWFWSRSNLFFGLPYYHVGVTLVREDASAWSWLFAITNGWNSVVDGNSAKSLLAKVAYARAPLALALLYLGGIERPEGAPEGRPWRHLLDTHATWDLSPGVALQVHLNGGLEPNRLGLSGWAAGALAMRLRVFAALDLSLRAEVFAEHAAERSGLRAAPIAWPVPWVSSGTLTLDYRPHPRASFRLEYRHDQASAALYFAGDVVGDGIAVPFVPNRRAQDTLTLGMTTWL